MDLGYKVFSKSFAYFGKARKMLRTDCVKGSKDERNEVYFLRSSVSDWIFNVWLCVWGGLHGFAEQ